MSEVKTVRSFSACDSLAYSFEATQDPFSPANYYYRKGEMCFVCEKEHWVGRVFHPSTHTIMHRGCSELILPALLKLEDVVRKRFFDYDEEHKKTCDDSQRESKTFFRAKVLVRFVCSPLTVKVFAKHAGIEGTKQIFEQAGNDAVDAYQSGRTDFDFQIKVQLETEEDKALRERLERKRKWSEMKTCCEHMISTGNYGEAVALAKQIESMDGIELITSICRCLAREGKVSEACGVARENLVNKDDDSYFSALATIAAAAADAKKFDEALEIYNQLPCKHNIDRMRNELALRDTVAELVFSREFVKAEALIAKLPPPRGTNDIFMDYITSLIQRSKS